MNSRAKLVTLGISLVVLSGCGGGGGGSSSNDTLTAVTNPAEITSQNAPVIAGAVVHSTLEGGDLGSFAGLGSGSIANNPNSQLFSKLGGIQNSQTESLRQKALNGALQAPLPPQTAPCLNGGTATVSGEINSSLTLSPGDTITVVFAACDDGFGVVTGSYAMRVTSFSGDFLSGSFSFGVAVTLTGFEVTSAGGTASADGEINISIDTSASPSLTVSVSSDLLSVSDGNASHTLSNFSMVQIVNEVTLSFTMNGSGTLTSSTFAGEVTFNISSSLQGVGDGFAFNGEFTVTGAENGSIRIIVLDEVFVRLEIDLDGDGVVDEIVDATWEELLAQG